MGFHVRNVHVHGHGQSLRADEGVVGVWPTCVVVVWEEGNRGGRRGRTGFISPWDAACGLRRAAMASVMAAEVDDADAGVDWTSASLVAGTRPVRWSKAYYL